MEERTEQGSVTSWVDRAKAGDPEAAKQLLNRYFELLAEYARRKLRGNFKQMADEEDVALLALNVIITQLRNGQLDSVSNRTDLWQIMTLIAERKARNQFKYETRKKRDSRRKQGDSAINSQPLQGRNLQNMASGDPAFLVEHAETCARLIAELPTDELKKIAALRLEGHLVREIAEQMKTPLRSIERKLEEIRSIWKGLADPNEENDK